MQNFDEYLYHTSAPKILLKSALSLYYVRCKNIAHNELHLKTQSCRNEYIKAHSSKFREIYHICLYRAPEKNFSE